MSLVSVIMPVYNVENYLKRAVDHIKNQTYEKWELILVNDGSEDASGDICDLFAKENNKIIVIHQENQGSGMARQKGLEQSKGKYIVFVDPDDYLKTEALKKNIEIAEKYKVQMVANSYNILTSDCKIQKNATRLKGYYDRPAFRKSYEEYRKIGDRTVWSKMYCRDFIFENDIKFTSLPVGQDALFNYEVYKRLDNIYIDRSAYYVYDSTRDNSAVKIYRKDRLKYEIQLINGLTNLFEEWKMLDQYENIVYMELFNSMTFELINLFGTTNDLSFRNKVNTFKENISTVSHSNMFNKLPTKFIKSKKGRLIFLLLKGRMYYLVSILFEINYKMK